MKLPDVLATLIPRTKEKETVYLSLFLDASSVIASFWVPDEKQVPRTLGIDFKKLHTDSWEERLAVVDELVGILEQKTGSTDVTRVILGLPNSYLTSTGEIQKEVRTEIKTLAHELELTPVGFVPLTQAIIYKIKKDEGIPPSVILLGVNARTFDVSLYKVGSLVGIRELERHEAGSATLEHGLKSFTDLEVLPARILLYGPDAPLLEDVKGELLDYPWTTKVNFLHFPKVELVTPEMIIESISLAGASELGNATGISEEHEEHEESEKHDEHKEKVGEHVSEEVAVAQEVIDKDFTTELDRTPTDANVVMVDSESLGFKKDVDVLEEEEQFSGVKKPEESVLARPSPPPVSRLNRVRRLIGKLPIPTPPLTNKFFLLLACVIVFGGATWLFFWLVPHAAVTVYEIPHELDIGETVTVDPTATIVDAENKILPGRKREQSVSAEKTVPVNGKKNVGDPAKGTVTIYNKSLSGRTFKKGTVLTSGSLQFSLDTDVAVASASESVGSITFGKADGAVTAVAIGSQSNLPGSTEFTFKDTSSSVAIGRSDKAFTGGTSREVSVVSRADLDAFIEDVSQELVEKAKQELTSAVEGSETLIDGTIKTTVTQKAFGQEIDQEARELQGKLTLSVTGVGVANSDIQALLVTIATDTVPPGYTIAREDSRISVDNVQIKKDGKITARVHMLGAALPAIDPALVQKEIAGSTLKGAEEYFRRLPGVGGMEVNFRFSPTKGRLPINQKNISVTVAVHP